MDKMRSEILAEYVAVSLHIIISYNIQLDLYIYLSFIYTDNLI